MFGAEAERAVVSSRSFRVGGDVFMAILAFKGIVMHHKSHTLARSVIVKMSGKFPEKAYEFCFVEGVFSHEVTERLDGIIEYYVVVSLPDHDIEQGSILIPGKHSFAVCESVLLHDAIEKKVDISDNPILPLLVREGIFAVLFVMHHFIAGTELPEYEHLVEKQEGKFLRELGEKCLRLLREVYETGRANNRCRLFFPEKKTEHMLAGFKETNLLSSVTYRGRVFT